MKEQTTTLKSVEAELKELKTKYRKFRSNHKNHPLAVEYATEDFGIAPMPLHVGVVAMGMWANCQDTAGVFAPL